MPAIAEIKVPDHMLACAEDYFAMPEGGPRYELINGIMLMAPSPDFDHQDKSGNLFYMLYGHVRQHHLGVVLAAPMDVRLNDHNVFQPDLMFISDERRHIITKTYIDGPPTLVVEILSPSTRKRDAVVKQPNYLKSGILELWLMDRKARKIIVQDFTDPKNVIEKTHGVGDVLSTRHLPGLVINLAEIFG